MVIDLLEVRFFVVIGDGGDDTVAAVGASVAGDQPHFTSLSPARCYWNEEIGAYDEGFNLKFLRLAGEEFTNHVLSMHTSKLKAALLDVDVLWCSAKCLCLLRLFVAPPSHSTHHNPHPPRPFTVKAPPTFGSRHDHGPTATICPLRPLICCKIVEKWGFITHKIVTGALVGGPDAYENFVDQRDNYEQTEPATYNNAPPPLMGLLARLHGGHDGYNQLLLVELPTLKLVNTQSKATPKPEVTPTLGNILLLHEGGSF
ncbi:endoglucanase 6 [Olea europaea subsp. europaea]|uniref:Endoglucanase n=1 Tax=Olea europaea subsp. europaea TaxID=158383 RepID=A0A8S0VBM4_OLEEU|nr:endoglucanase 6 [Olea europaea subsp. europaea]